MKWVEDVGRDREVSVCSIVQTYCDNDKRAILHNIRVELKSHTGMPIQHTEIVIVIPYSPQHFFLTLISPWNHAHGFWKLHNNYSCHRAFVNDKFFEIFRKNFCGHIGHWMQLAVMLLKYGWLVIEKNIINLNAFPLATINQLSAKTQAL